MISKNDIFYITCRLPNRVARSSTVMINRNSFGEEGEMSLKEEYALKKNAYKKKISKIEEMIMIA